MSANSIDNATQTKTEFTGFHVTEAGKARLEEMADFFKEKGMIQTKTISEAARKCLDIGWTIVTAMTEAEAEGKIITSVTIPLKNLALNSPLHQTSDF